MLVDTASVFTWAMADAKADADESTFPDAEAWELAYALNELWNDDRSAMAPCSDLIVAFAFAETGTMTFA
jgi:hypothetical protein